MKKLIALLILVTVCLPGCAKEEKWHPESTEVVFDTQQIIIAKIEDYNQNTDGDCYRVTAMAQSSTEPYYNLKLTAVITTEYCTGKYFNPRDDRYSGYKISEISDTEIYGGAENLQWITLGNEEIFIDILPEGDTAVLWINGYYQAEHDKKVKNASDYLPGMFFNWETTVKEYFRTENVSMFIKLYPEEIISCSPQPYHLQIECTDGGVK